MISGAPFAKAGTHRTKAHREVRQLVWCDDSLVPVIITPFADQAVLALAHYQQGHFEP